MINGTRNLIRAMGEDGGLMNLILCGSHTQIKGESVRARWAAEQGDVITANGVMCLSGAVELTHSFSSKQLRETPGRENQSSVCRSFVDMTGT